MKWFGLGKSHYSLEEREQNRTTRSEGIRDILFVTGIVVLYFVAFLGLTLSLSPVLDKRASEQELELKQQELKTRLAEEKRLINYHDALNNNAALNEAVAHDAGFAHPGETIIHIPANVEPIEPTEPVRD